MQVFTVPIYDLLSNKSVFNLISSFYKILYDIILLRSL